MTSGQITLNSVTDAQLEAILDVKKNNEGSVTLVSIQVVGQPGPTPPWPAPHYGYGSPWGIEPGVGIWYGPGSPHGAVPPCYPHTPVPLPSPAETTYNVTLAWSKPEGMKVIALVFDRLSSIPG